MQSRRGFHLFANTAKRWNCKLIKVEKPATQVHHDQLELFFEGDEEIFGAITSSPFSLLPPAGVAGRSAPAGSAASRHRSLPTNKTAVPYRS